MGAGDVVVGGGVVVVVVVVVDLIIVIGVWCERGVVSFSLQNEKLLR